MLVQGPVTKRTHTARANAKSGCLYFFSRISSTKVLTAFATSGAGRELRAPPNWLT